MDKSVNQLIKEIPKLLNKRQSDVAAELGVSRQAYSNWCKEGNYVGKKVKDKILSKFAELGENYFSGTNLTNANMENELIFRTILKLQDRIERLEEEVNNLKNEKKKDIA